MLRTADVATGLPIVIWHRFPLKPFLPAVFAWLAGALISPVILINFGLLQVPKTVVPIAWAGLFFFGLLLAALWWLRPVPLAVRERDVARADAREQIRRSEWLESISRQSAGVAHTLATPLGTLRILLDELLDERSLTESARADIELMQRQVERCKEALSELNRLNQLTQRAAGAQQTEGVLEVLHGD